MGNQRHFRELRILHYHKNLAVTMLGSKLAT
jgi:hypothetical protein